MARFRTFMISQGILREEAAPPAGSSPPPENPNATSDYFARMQQELGIDDDVMPQAMAGGVNFYRIPQFNWGFRVRPPVPAIVQDKGHGIYEVRFLLKQKKLMDPKGFYTPYKQGENPFYYQGPVEDKTETMNSKELADAIEPAAFPGTQPMAPSPMGGM